MDPVKPAGDGFGDLFNSRLEAGIRAVVVLELMRPETADLSEMVLFDHVVVHTADFGGPPWRAARAAPADRGQSSDDAAVSPGRGDRSGGRVGLARVR